MPKREDGAMHTPGPWKASTEQRGFLRDGKPAGMQTFHTIEACHPPQGVNGRSLILAEMRVGDEAFRFDGFRHRVSDDEAAANARLIAAAPAMYEALLAVTKCGNGGARLSRDASDKARAALAAATPRAD